MKLSFVAKDLTVFNPFISGGDEVVVDTELNAIDGDAVLLRNPENGEFLVTFHCDLAPAPKEILIGVVVQVNCFDSEDKRKLRLKMLMKGVA